MGVEVGLLLLLFVLTSLPPFQQRIAREASSILSKQLDTKVTVGNVFLGLFNRVVIDDVFIDGQDHEPMLQAARISAKIDILPLLEGQIRISNIQLLGFDISLHKSEDTQPYNFQFIIDRFASKDTTKHTPLDLAIKTILIRRGTIEHRTPAKKLDFVLKDFYAKASIDALTDDSINVSVSQLSYADSVSGLKLSNLHFQLEGNRRTLALNDLGITLPGSDLHTSLAVSKKEASPTLFDGFTTIGMSVRGTLTGKLTPSDLSPVLPLTSGLKSEINIGTDIDVNGGLVRLTDTQLSGDDFYWKSTLMEAQLEQDSQLVFSSAEIDLNRFFAGNSFLNEISSVIAQEIKSPPTANTITGWIGRAGSIDASGKAYYSKQLSSAQLNLLTKMGKVKAEATLKSADEYNIMVDGSDIMIPDVANNIGVQNASITSKGKLKEKTLDTEVDVTGLVVGKLAFNNLNADILLSPRQLKGFVNADGEALRGNVSADLLSATDFKPTLAGLDNLNGSVQLSDIHWRNGEKTLDFDDLTITTSEDDKERQLEIDGDFVNLQASGRYSYATLVPIARQLLHRAMPTLVPAPQNMAGTSQGFDYLRLYADIFSLEPLATLTGIDISIPESAHFTASLNQSSRTLQTDGNFPLLRVGGETLRNTRWLLREVADSIHASISTMRQMGDNQMALQLESSVTNDIFHTQIEWDNLMLPAFNGIMRLNSQFFKDVNAHMCANINVEPSHAVIADTVWNVHPSAIRFDNGKIHINNFYVSSSLDSTPMMMADARPAHSLQINGIASDEATDTLHVELQAIDLQYVFNLINFHAVEFAGHATGSVDAYSIMKAPRVDANIEVPDFTLNDGLLGHLFLNGGFARLGEKTIDLNGLIHEPVRGGTTSVTGTVVPGHDEGSGLDLEFNAQYLNAYFINFFTNSIFDNLQGHATGHAHLFGPFKKLDIEGDLLIDTASIGIPVIGTRYYISKEPLRLRPGVISIDHVKASDAEGHQGTITGRLKHDHFSNLSFTFDIDAERLLCYDFHEFGDQSFYGTVYATGRVRLNGQPGQLTVDLEGTPTAGTVFTYNATSPDISTNNEFISFKPLEMPAARSNPAEYTDTIQSVLSANATPAPATDDTDESETESKTDIRINFNLDITPEATMRLLMDKRSEDYITVQGSGNIHATYYNKGSFQMFGTYTVDNGLYRLSLQDIIRKDFHLERGSTLTFQGAPMKGELNIKAIYTVPGVSLNDLAVGNNFSNSTVRVNCIMNITGQAGKPQVAFDFDIPNVNEDEKQMVRTLISTEEERNMQVIYLLGIGRFYTYNAEDPQMQTNSAMQSLLSTTLSGQLNEYLRRAIGDNGNWNFGTSLSTGELGWQDMDVEGMLSGRLLNNRLLINGTFGYRDTPVANTNFIGDFDVQWLLTPHGTVSLKAYSETNDRYFTKTALTTQGIGIQLKKDFNTLGELFRRGAKKKK
ncbi:MAG: translocation/assembly module TamB [Bacteroidaceae bacterium]|nr:translocation/assembly module TamB [Bacteroidaceae bacterium]